MFCLTKHCGNDVLRNEFVFDRHRVRAVGARVGCSGQILLPIDVGFREEIGVITIVHVDS